MDPNFNALKVDDTDKRVFVITKSPVAEWGRVALSIAQRPKGRSYYSAGRYLIVELLAAIDDVGIPVHGEFIWLYFVDNLPSGYELIKRNLQSSKEPLTRTVLEDALRSRYNVQFGGKRGKAIMNTALFASGSKVLEMRRRAWQQQNQCGKPGPGEEVSKRQPLS